MNCQTEKKKRYLQIANDELRPKGETLEEHRKHCKAKPGNCPFERHLEEADRIPSRSSFVETKSKYRQMRNELAAKCKGDGTYDLEKGGDPIEPFKTGWQVSFQEDTTEDPTHGHYITDSDYDATVERLAKETNSKPYLGYFDGKPEIGFHCESREMAMQIARRFNQESIFDWSTYGTTFKCPDNIDRRGQDHFVNGQNKYTPNFHNSNPME